MANIGDGNSCHSVEFYNHTAILTNTIDRALDPLKQTIEDTDTLTYLLREVHIAEKHDTVVLDRGYTHEVIHLTVRDTDDL